MSSSGSGLPEPQPRPRSRPPRSGASRRRSAGPSSTRSTASRQRAESTAIRRRTARRHWRPPRSRSAARLTAKLRHRHEGGRHDEPTALVASPALRRAVHDLPQLVERLDRCLGQLELEAGLLPVQWRLSNLSPAIRRPPLWSGHLSRRKQDPPVDAGLLNQDLCLVNGCAACRVSSRGAIIRSRCCGALRGRDRLARSVAVGPKRAPVGRRT
jgi:hypothetical protein